MNLATLITILPVMGFSIISLAVIVERFLFFYKNKIDIGTYREYLPGNLTQLKAKCLETHKNHIFDFFIFRLLSNSKMSKEETSEFLDSSFADIYLQYQKRINYLGIFAKLSTLLGLLGTVIGMIIAFNNIVEQGTSTASIVAGGISAALITTAVGLSVAIPTTFFHDFFQNKTEREIKKIEIVISEIMIVLYKIKKTTRF